jgi:hypothetical protein
MKAEKSACPLAAEGDSPIFAAKRGSSKKHVLAAAKIGTVPCARNEIGRLRPYHFRQMDLDAIGQRLGVVAAFENAD